MYPNTRLVYMLLTCALVALVAVACTSSKPVNLDYRFSEGEVTKYDFQTTQKGQVTIDGSTEEFDLRLANTIAQTVQSVDELGVATIDASYETSRLTVDGQELPLPEFANTAISYEINGDGAITNVTGTHGLAGPLGERQFDPAQVFQFQGPIFQSGDLKKGDKWQQTISIPLAGTDPLQATIRYVYEGREKVNGKEAAKLSFVFETPFDVFLEDLEMVVRVVGREEIRGTVLFSIADGRVISAKGKGPLQLSMMMPSEGGGEEIERLKVEIDVDFDYTLQEEKK